MSKIVRYFHRNRDHNEVNVQGSFEPIGILFTRDELNEYKKEQVLAYLGITEEDYNRSGRHLKDEINTWIENSSLNEELPFDLLNRIRNIIPSNTTSSIELDHITLSLNEQPQQEELDPNLFMIEFNGETRQFYIDNIRIDIQPHFRDYFQIGNPPEESVPIEVAPTTTTIRLSLVIENTENFMFLQSLVGTRFNFRHRDIQGEGRVSQINYGRPICNLMIEVSRTEANFREESKEKYDLKIQKKFKINEYLTLKLEANKTNIYVKGKRFDQCKFLLLNLEEGKEYKEIKSIDEAAKKLNKDMEYDHSLISPETEFWGHCSNIQAWVENNYDLRIIHTNLGIPLLKKLIECEDKKALTTWKEEIMFRIQETRTKAYKMYEKDIEKYFNDEEKEVVYNIIFPTKDSFIEMLLNMTPEEYIEFQKQLQKDSYKLKRIQEELDNDYYFGERGLQE